MRFERKTVTPALAVEYLKRNIQTNRPLNHGHIDRLAADIIEGRWLCLPHGLVFDTRGRLIDGQHRLEPGTGRAVMVAAAAATGAAAATDGSVSEGQIDSETEDLFLVKLLLHQGVGKVKGNGRLAELWNEDS